MSQLGWRMRPNLAAWYTQEGKGFVRANDEGMRDRNHLLDKPAGVYRIAVLGDSYAEARQVEREQAFWALLPEELAACGFQKGKRIEALNFGVSGYGTAQEYLMLQTNAIRYRPDLVLLQFTNGNDVRNNSFALEPEKYRPFFMLAADGSLRIDESFASSDSFRARSSFTSEAVRKMTDRSRVLQLVRHVKEHSFIRTAQANDTWIMRRSCLSWFIQDAPLNSRLSGRGHCGDMAIAVGDRGEAALGFTFAGQLHRGYRHETDIIGKVVGCVVV